MTLTPVRERLQALFIPEPNTGCWLWLGALNKTSGYGTMGIKVNDAWKTHYAHRVSYETFVAPIPAKSELDHKCRVRCCVNPDHLEPVSHSENMLRSPLLGSYESSRIHCPRGHVYSGLNARGARICRVCEINRHKRWHAKAAAERMDAVRAGCGR